MEINKNAYIPESEKELQMISDHMNHYDDMIDADKAGKKRKPWDDGCPFCTFNTFNGPMNCETCILSDGKDDNAPCEDEKTYTIRGFRHLKKKNSPEKLKKRRTYLIKRLAEGNGKWGICYK